MDIRTIEKTANLLKQKKCKPSLSFPEGEEPRVFINSFKSDGKVKYLLFCPTRLPRMQECERKERVRGKRSESVNLCHSRDLERKRTPE
jgi:hypothetical protein